MDMCRLDVIEEIVIDDDFRDTTLPRLPDPVVIQPEQPKEEDSKDDALHQALALLYSQEGDLFIHEKEDLEGTCKQEDELLQDVNVSLGSYVTDHQYTSRTEIVLDNKFYENINRFLNILNVPRDGLSTAVFLDPKDFNVTIVDLPKEGKTTLYSCFLCGFQFLTMELLNKHYSTQHEKHISNFVISRGINGEFPCRCCTKTFTTQYSAFRHELMHTGQADTYQCEFCDRKFNNCYSLFRHIHLIHKGDKNHECLTCGKKFGLAQTLRSHMRIHTGERPYKCEFCDACFRDKAHLSRHQTSHSDYKPWKCDLCDKTYKRKDKLRKHLLTHDNDKAYKCAHCKRSYDTTDELQLHQEQCHKDGPVKCGVCKKKYCNKLYLSKHKCKPQVSDDECDDEDDDDDTDMEYDDLDIKDEVVSDIVTRSIATRSSSRQRKKVCKPGCSCCDSD